MTSSSAPAWPISQAGWLVQWALPIPVGWTVVYFWRRQVQRGKLPDPFALPDTGAQAEPS